MKEGYPIVVRMTQADIDAGKADSIVGARIEVIDSVGVPTGVVYESGAIGPPTLLVTGSNINTVMQSAGGAGWAKAQATTANHVIARPASGASLDLHIEVGGSLAALTAANWPVPASGVDQLRIRNFSGAAKAITAGAGWTMVTADGNPLTGGSYSIPDDRAVELTLDPDGFAQVVPWGGEVSQAEHASHTGNTANPHGTTKAHVGLGNVDNTADANKPVASTGVNGLMSAADKTKLDGVAAGAEVNVQSDWNAASGDAQILNRPTIPTVMTGATPITAGASGLVPTPAAGDDDNFLRGDGTYQTLTSVAAASTVTTNISNQNLNNVTITGFLGGVNLTNTPIVSADWWFVINMTHFGSANWQMQFARRFSPGSPTLYTRLKDNGVWGAWVSIATV